MADAWILVQLNEDACIIDDQTAIIKEISRVFGDKVKYYLPFHLERGLPRQYSKALFDGYAFINADDRLLSEAPSIVFRRCYTLESIVLQPNGKPCTVTTADIQRYKTLAEEESNKFSPKYDDVVSPIVGQFKDLPGTVISVNTENKTADVLFEMRSRKVTTTLPTYSLRPVTREDITKVIGKEYC